MVRRYGPGTAGQIAKRPVNIGLARPVRRYGLNTAARGRKGKLCRHPLSRTLSKCFTDPPKTRHSYPGEVGQPRSALDISCLGILWVLLIGHWSFLVCPNNCPPSTALLILRTRSKTPPQPLGRLEELLGRRWDGLKRKKPLESLVWDGGTAGTGGWGGMPPSHRGTGH